MKRRKMHGRRCVMQFDANKLLIHEGGWGCAKAVAKLSPVLFEERCSGNTLTMSFTVPRWCMSSHTGAVPLIPDSSSNLIAINGAALALSF